MSKLKILIIEDEAIVAEDIAARLEEAGYEISCIVDSGNDAIEAARKDLPDLALIDIHIKGDKDGIQTAELLNRDFSIPIIYLTAFSDSQTLERAKKTFPSAYIIKPFRERELQVAIELALYKQDASATVPAAKPPALFRQEDRFFIKTGNRFEKIYLKELYWLEANRSYCEVVTAKKKYMLATSLNSLAAQLDHPVLVRIHRSFMVNTELIDAFEGNFIVIKNQEIPIGASYRDDFLQRFRFI